MRVLGELECAQRQLLLLTRWLLTIANEPGFRTLAMMFWTPKVRIVSMHPEAINVSLVDLSATISTVWSSSAIL